MDWNGVTARKILLTTCAAIALSGGITTAYAQQREKIKSYAIQEQHLADALRQFAIVSGRDLSFSAELVQGKTAHDVRGNFSEEQALELLLKGTGLEFEKNTTGVLVLRKRPGLMKTVEAAGDIRVPGRPVQTAAAAEPSEAAVQSVEEVVITGSRIVREGYEAPTPLTVIGTETLERAADTNVVALLSTMPAITGASTASSSLTNLGPGTGAIQSLNLRSLGANRVLILLDGQRASPSTFAGVVDVSSFPSQLMQRVDVVTGGASAVYGSDAITGVVNFILDKEFTGVKGEISGGMTNYGDAQNFKVDLSAGFPFADGRGHVLLSGEYLYDSGIKGDGGRALKNGLGNELNMPNPTYTSTNGQPQFLLMGNGSLATATAGGLIVAGPLKGTAFGDGGVPYQFRYGPIVSGSTMFGGDAGTNSIKNYSDMAPVQKSPMTFVRISYDITDNITAFAQWGWAQNYNRSSSFVIWMPGSATSYIIRNDNPYIPQVVRDAMTSTGQTQFAIGSWNADMPTAMNNNRRLSNRINAGLDGKFDAFETSWTWNAYYAYGATKTSPFTDVAVRSRYLLAIDAVVNPANGQIVCRSVLLGANNGCRPWNPMGIGVNGGNQESYNWMQDGGAFQRGLIQQTTMAASVTGAPFSSWAGPVSIALSIEHRKDEIHATADAAGTAGARVVGNYAPIDGAQSVTEGAVETVIPLAQGQSWASNWDFTAAARFTGYELAGYVTTYKFGTTYAPIDDLKIRVTRSRDIRAPNIQELFAAPFTQAGTSGFDRFRNEQIPGSMTAAIAGNPALVPEKSDTTGLGIVYSPSYISGFTASIDYWDVNIKGSIQNTNNQIIIDSCFTGLIPSNCANMTRGPAEPGQTFGPLIRILNFPINMATQNVKGLDLESSYRFSMSSLVDSWNGVLSLHGLMTFYLRNYANTRFVPPTYNLGQNGGNAALPRWKYNVTASYDLEPMRLTLTARGFSSGKINGQYFECTAGCPPATVAMPTVNFNKAPGAFYLDANIDYGLEVGDVRTNVFVSAKNIFNKGSPPIPSTYYYTNALGAPMYDVLGVVFRAGVRFKI